MNCVLSLFDFRTESSTYFGTQRPNSTDPELSGGEMLEERNQ